MDSSVRLKPVSLLLAVVGLAGAACGLTLLYLGMREVMEIGGACAEGGAFEIRQPCPDGVPELMMGGVFGGLVCLAVFGVAASNFGGGYNRLVLWAWPVLFVSLGWNFLEYGLDPPDQSGTVVAWLVCAGLFFLMGGAPLLFLLTPSQLRATFWPREDKKGKRRAPVGLRAVERVLERSSGAGAATVNPRFSAGSAGAGGGAAQEASGGTAAASARGPAAAGFVTDAFLPKPVAGGGDDVVGRLERLARLRADGALDDAEYERAKQAVLGGKGA